MTQEGEPRGMKNFIIIWFGQTISMFGSGLGSFALGVWVFQRSGSVTDFALISVFAALPNLLLSPLAGVLVDRWDRRWAMILTDSVAGLCTLTIALLVFYDNLQIWHIYLIVMTITTFGALQGPALSASIPLLVPKSQLGRASGMQQAGSALSNVAAPMLAGFLLLAIGLNGVMVIDFVTFLIAVGSLLLIRIPRPPVSETGRAARGTIYQEALFGFTYLLRRPGLMALLMLYAATNISLGMVIVLLQPLILSFADAAALGTVMSISSVGLLLGAIAVSVWGGARRRVAAILTISAIQGVLLILGGLWANIYFIAAVAFVFLFLNPVVSAADRVLWQIKIPLDVQGRIFATRRIFAGISLPIAYLIAGPLADKVAEPMLAPGGALADSVGRIIGVGPGRGIGLIIIAMGVLMILVVFLAWLHPRLRRVEEEIPDVVNDERNRTPAAPEEGEAPAAGASPAPQPEGAGG